VALGILVCLYNAPQLLFGTVQFDGVDVHYSAQRYLSDELHAARLPFWTPYIFSGFPFLADLQVGAWYPLNWPFLLVGVTPRAIGGELLLHSLVACGGAYALAVRWLGRPPAAAVTAMFYGLSGWFATHSQHVGMFDTAAWLAWLLLVADLVADRLNITRLTLAALLGAMLALPGHFQVALYALSGVAVWAALEAVARRAWLTGRRLAAALLAVSIGGGVLSAVMILPALELVGQSVRTQLNARSVDIGYFHPASLATLVDPDYYGLLSGHYTGPGDNTQHYFYAGLLLVPLALVGIGTRRVLRTACFLGVPFLWYALGPSGGLFNLVARLPGFSSVELPMHGWFLPALGLALLAGAGFARLVATREWLAGVLVAVLFVDLVTVNQLLNPLAYARSSFAELYGASLQSFAEMAGSVERLYGAPLAQVGYRNHALQSRVETTYGYNPLELLAYADYAAAAEANPLLIPGFAVSHRLLDDRRVAPEARPLPLAYLARRVVSVADAASTDEALNTLDPSQATITVGESPPVSAGSVSVVERGLDSVTLDYTADAAGLIRVAIPLYPGWTATLNGTALPLLRVDRAFTGLVVPAGQGEVRMQYRPRWFWLGASISGLAAAAVAAILCADGARRLRRRD
jgi:hypothetical protein